MEDFISKYVYILKKLHKMIIKNSYSPNFSKKSRKNNDINLIIIHYTGMQSKIASIKRLINPKHKVSCHYLIDRKRNS